MAVRYFTFTGLIVFLLTGCTIKPPPVNITSDRTALENQLLGTRSKLTEDPFSTAAVWSAGMAPETAMFPGVDTSTTYDRAAKRELIIAQIRRQTIQGDVYELKRKGYLGEKNDGLLIVMSDTIRGYAAVRRLADSENHDRQVIMQFYSRSRGIETEAGFLDVKRSFALAMAEVSPTGSWIQNAAGDWVRK